MSGNIEQRLNPEAMAYPPDGPPPPSGPAPDIEVDPDLLDRASGSAGDIHQDLTKDGRYADDSTTEAANKLGRENFLLGDRLRKTQETWGEQMDVLLLACQKVEDGLAATAEGHRLVEDENTMTIEEITKHFN